MNLAGKEDYKEICEDARLEDRAHFELITPRIYELGGQLPADIRGFADRAGRPAAFLPGYSGMTQEGVETVERIQQEPVKAADILEVLLEAERCAIRTWSEICDLTFGKDPRTYDMAARILNEEVEHEAWFIELLSFERDGISRPSGHFRRGDPGEAPYSKRYFRQIRVIKQMVCLKAASEHQVSLAEPIQPCAVQKPHPAPLDAVTVLLCAALVVPYPRVPRAWSPAMIGSSGLAARFTRQHP